MRLRLGIMVLGVSVYLSWCAASHAALGYRSLDYRVVQHPDSVRLAFAHTVDKSSSQSMADQESIHKRVGVHATDWNPEHAKKLCSWTFKETD